jgi:hypothetical protein
MYVLAIKASTETGNWQKNHLYSNGNHVILSDVRPPDKHRIVIHSLRSDQHSTAQHSTAQHSTAQHSTAQRTEGASVGLQ